MIKPGTRIEIAQRYDRWVGGKRRGTVITVSGDRAEVEMDHKFVVPLTKFPIKDLTPLGESHG